MGPITWGASRRRPQGGVGRATRLLVNLSVPVLQLCLKDLQFYLLQTDLLLLSGRKSSTIFSIAFNQSSIFPLFHFQRYLEHQFLGLLRVLSFSCGTSLLTLYGYRFY